MAIYTDKSGKKMLPLLFGDEEKKQDKGSGESYWF